MPERNFSTRIGDSIEGNVLSYLRIQIHPNGDAFVFIKGVDSQGKPSEAQLQFLSIPGGGYHPHTIRALFELIEAMEKDNKDLGSPSRYNLKRLTNS